MLTPSIWRYHFVHEKIIKGPIDLNHARIDEQVVDVFTKPLPREKLFKFRRKFGLHDLNMCLKVCVLMNPEQSYKEQVKNLASLYQKLKISLSFCNGHKKV